VNTLRTRLLAAFAYVLVLVLLALAVPFAVSISRRAEAEVKGQATTEALLIAASVAGGFDDREALRRLVRRAGDDVRGRVLVVDSRGRVVADSEGDRFVGASYADRPEIAAVLATGTTAQGTRRSETLDEELLYTAVPVVEEGVRVGAVRVTRSTAPIDSRVRRDVLALAGIAAAALVLGLALAWMLAGSLARPLRALAATARRVGGGDLDARADRSGSSEQQEVAAAFNEMTERLGRVLAAQREFVANASHQLRTPLTGLRLRLEAASLQVDDEALEAELLAAEREVERLARLLAALLTLAREGATAEPPQPVELTEAARAACERWEGEAERGGRRLHVVGEETVWAASSREDVAIVLDNLVENALLYTPPGTEVTIETARQGDRALLAVSDEGAGLRGEDPERLFERFARGASGGSVPGTGLGLAIVRTLARRWGGEATIADAPGGGARAEVVLPVAQPGVEVTAVLDESEVPVP
jgi:signal transduction histidine kinase